MSLIKCDQSISIDGFTAGANQSLESVAVVRCGFVVKIILPGCCSHKIAFL